MFEEGWLGCQVIYPEGQVTAILCGGRFVMKETNNMPLSSSLENIPAIYRAVKDFGFYQ